MIQLIFNFIYEKNNKIIRKYILNNKNNKKAFIFRIVYANDKNRMASNISIL